MTDIRVFWRGCREGEGGGGHKNKGRIELFGISFFPNDLPSFSQTIDLDCSMVQATENTFAGSAFFLAIKRVKQNNTINNAYGTGARSICRGLLKP